MSGIDPPSLRLQAKMEELWEQFLAGILDTRDFKKMHEHLYGLAQWRESGKLSDHDFVVKILKLLNTFGEPMTRELMEKYGIGDFALTSKDFDHICLDFLSSACGERMIIDFDSIPEGMTELPPMHIDEIGNVLKGTLAKTEDGRWYLKGKNDRWFPLAQSLSSQQAQEVTGKTVEARIKDGRAHEFSVLE